MSFVLSLSKISTLNREHFSNEPSNMISCSKIEEKKLCAFEAENTGQKIYVSKIVH